MSRFRFRLLVALTVVAALAVPGVASAKLTKITGGSTSIALSSAASSVLAANHLTVTPLGAATASGSTFTFPVVRGRINAKLHGFVINKGGFALSNGTRTVRVRDLTVASTKTGVSVFALVAGSAHGRCDHGGLLRRLRCHLRHSYRAHVARIARVTGVSVSGDTATGTVDLTAASARAINRLAGTRVVSAGAPIGTGTLSVTLG